MDGESDCGMKHLRLWCQERKQDAQTRIDAHTRVYLLQL